MRIAVTALLLASCSWISRQEVKDRFEELWDDDGDGYPDVAGGGTDCDDTSDAIHPGAMELCDGVDNDCDGATDGDDPDGCARTLDDAAAFLGGDDEDGELGRSIVAGSFVAAPTQQLAMGTQTGRVYVFDWQGGPGTYSTGADAIEVRRGVANGFGKSVAVIEGGSSTGRDLLAVGAPDAVSSGVHLVEFEGATPVYTREVTTALAEGLGDVVATTPATLIQGAGTSGPDLVTSVRRRIGSSDHTGVVGFADPRLLDEVSRLRLELEEGVQITAIAIGDVTADGNVDLIIGAAQSTPPGETSPRGVVWVHEGPIPADLGGDWRDLTGGDYRLVGDDDSGFGSHLAVADVDRDGHADLLVSAPGLANAEIAGGHTMGGAVLVFTGPLTSSDNTIADADYAIVTAEPDADLGPMAVLERPESTALAFGAPGWGDEGRGAAFVLITTDDATPAPGAIAVDSSDIRIIGTDADYELGASVCLSPDLTGDSRATIIVGLPGALGRKGAVAIFPIDD